MTIQIHDTLTRQRVPLKPIRSGEVGMYVCGPTVYDDCHIGHLMGPVLFDAVARWLKARGHRVRFVNNITDVDDKIITRSQSTGEPWQDITERYTAMYFDYLRRLGVTTITDHPKCTEYIPQMVAFVERLIAEDRAYETSDGVYYDVARQPAYGKLSGRKLEDMVSGSRVERSTELRNAADFVVWKKAKPGEPTWDSPWGPGRPGWHLECSVMGSELLGEVFDLHGGGDDLKFPHHENEIAQAEALDMPFAKTWMHHGLVQYGGVKVAKSDPRMKDESFSRQFQVRWLLDTYGGPTLRFFLLRGHYRRPIDFEPKNLEAARTSLQRLWRQYGEAFAAPGEGEPAAVLTRDLPADLAEYRDRFAAAMDDDFGTGEAIAVLFSLARHERSAEQGALLRDLGRLLGLFQAEDAEHLQGGGGEDDGLVSGLVDLLIEMRQQARARKDFAQSDEIRDRLAGMGIRLLDGPDGTTWERA